MSQIIIHLSDKQNNYNKSNQTFSERQSMTVSAIMLECLMPPRDETDGRGKRQEELIQLPDMSLC